MRISINRSELMFKEPEFFSGYSRKGKSKGTHDPLFISLFKIAGANYNLFIFSLDLLNVEKKFSDQLTLEVNQLYPNSYNIVLISATHTHSGPAIFPLPSLANPITEGLRAGLLTKAIQLVKDNQGETSQEITNVFLEQGAIKDFYGNRNQPSAYADKSYLTLKFSHHNQIIGAIVNLACHPTILKSDNDLFSADLFGRIRSQLNEAWSCPVLLLNGACGDVSSRYYAAEATFDEVERIGDGIVKQILAPNTSKEISLELVKASAVEENIYYDGGQDVFWQEKLKELDQLANAELRQIMTQHLQNKFHKIAKVTSLYSKQIIFSDLIIVTISGELVAEFEKYIRQVANRPVLIICYEHGYSAYLVNQGEYGHNFESYLSRLPIGAADTFVSKLSQEITFTY